MRGTISTVAVAAMLAASGLLQAQTATAPVVKGCVVTEGSVGVTGLALVRRLVKVAGAAGTYRATLEVEGVALAEVLDRARVKKKADDGFGREIDTYVVVRGARGQAAVFSWGELFAGNGEGPILAERARWRIPGHHSQILAAAFDVALFRDPAGRAAIDLKSCTSCHEGPKPPRLDMPRGWLLAVPGDGFGGRFVEEVSEIEVVQTGLKAIENREAKEKGFVPAPTVVGPDGKETVLTAQSVAGLPRREAGDATVGMGRGYHGTNRWEGVDLGAALLGFLPAGADPRQVWVLVTALDGYRTLYSGSEVFVPPPGEGVLLVDREGGKELGPGAGRLRTVPLGDFFIDRGVRLVKEIRLGLAK